MDDREAPLIILGSKIDIAGTLPTESFLHWFTLAMAAGWAPNPRPGYAPAVTDLVSR